MMQMWSYIADGLKSCNINMIKKLLQYYNCSTYSGEQCGLNSEVVLFLWWFWGGIKSETIQQWSLSFGIWLVLLLVLTDLPIARPAWRDICFLVNSRITVQIAYKTQYIPLYTAAWTYASCQLLQTRFKRTLFNITQTWKWHFELWKSPQNQWFKQASWIFITLGWE